MMVMESSGFSFLGMIHNCIWRRGSSSGAQASIESPPYLLLLPCPLRTGVVVLILVLVSRSRMYSLRQLIWIQRFPSPRLVALPYLKNKIFPHSRKENRSIQIFPTDIEEKHEQLCPGFELDSPIQFPVTITVTPSIPLQGIKQICLKLLDLVTNTQNYITDLKCYHQIKNNHCKQLSSNNHYSIRIIEAVKLCTKLLVFVI